MRNAFLLFTWHPVSAFCSSGPNGPKRHPCLALPASSDPPASHSALSLHGKLLSRICSVFSPEQLHEQRGQKPHAHWSSGRDPILIGP